MAIFASFLWPPCVADTEVIFLPCGFFLWSPYGIGRPYIFFLSFLWPPYVIGQAIIFLPSGFFFLLLFFSSPNLSRHRLDVYHVYTWCGPSVNLECRSETCCTQLAGNAGPKKSPSGHHCTTLSGYNYGRPME